MAEITTLGSDNDIKYFIPMLEEFLAKKA